MKLTFTEVTAPQRSPEWFAARAGRMTGSAAGAMLSTIKSGEAAARRDLRFKLAVERLMGAPESDDVYQNEHILRGIEKEPAARMMLEEVTGLIVRESGFLSCNELPIGCSLDGDIDDYAAIAEIKCPKTSTHIGYLESGAMPSTYRAQVMHNLLVSGAKSCHFVSFDDRLPEKLSLFHVEVRAADLPIEEYVKSLTQFLSEVDDLYNTLLKKAA